MNKYDSDRILDLVKPIGYVVTNNALDADCYILNTCHIREKATDKVYHDIGRLKKEFRNKKKPMLLVTGCVAQAENNEMLNREKYIDGVVGPQSYHQIPNIIKEIESYKNKNKNKINRTEFEAIDKFDSLNLVGNANSKISSYLTIQEGCDKFCHFCVVPYTRGPEYSRSMEEIIIEAKQLIGNGSKEITLLGQNVNAYKYENKGSTFRLADLIIKLNKFKELKRIRYTTSHPNDVTEDLIQAHRSCEKLMPILHLPVQSGSSKILKAMNRKHNIVEYTKILEDLKKARSDIKFSSDFIIGYPGETEDDFNQTLELIEKVKFINSYSFIYSARPGTPASKLDNINQDIAKKRLLILQAILEKNNSKYKEAFLDRCTEVLFENKLDNQSKYFGRDKFLNSVIVQSSKNLVGQILDVKISGFNHNNLFGTILFNEKRNFAA